MCLSSMYIIIIIFWYQYLFALKVANVVNADCNNNIYQYFVTFNSKKEIQSTNKNSNLKSVN